MNERIICESCSKQKQAIKKVASKLLPKSLLLCDTCINQNFEPRYIVILAHMGGVTKAIDFIRSRKYLGEEIKLSEVL